LKLGHWRNSLIKSVDFTPYSFFRSQENMNNSPKKAVKSMIYSMFWLNIGMDKSRAN